MFQCVDVSDLVFVPLSHVGDFDRGASPGEDHGVGSGLAGLVAECIVRRVVQPRVPVTDILAMAQQPRNVRRRSHLRNMAPL